MLNQKLNNVNNFALRHGFSSIFEFSLVGSEVFFSSCLKKFFGSSPVYNVPCVTSSWFFYLLHFVTILASFYSFYPFLFEPITQGQLKPFKKSCSNFILAAFFHRAMFIFVSISEQKIKLSTVTSKARKYLIHLNRH